MSKALHRPRHPHALPSRGGAMGMQAGDRVRSTIDGRTGVADEFTHDGETYMAWDDGTFGVCKWNHLEPATAAHLVQTLNRLYPPDKVAAVLEAIIRTAEDIRKAWRK